MRSDRFQARGKITGCMSVSNKSSLDVPMLAFLWALNNSQVFIELHKNAFQGLADVGYKMSEEGTNLLADPLKGCGAGG